MEDWSLQLLYQSLIFMNKSVKNKKLLIIDDDETFCSIMARVQKRSGFEVYTATNSQQTMEICQQYKPEYAIVDLKIGSESGLELIPKLMQSIPTIRIIILTGYATRQRAH